MAGKRVDIDIKTTADTSGIKKLDQAVEASGKKAEAAAKKASAANRMSIQNVSFQLQDIAVQAEMGVSASRIIGQQVPQLLGGFGAVGAAIGATVAIGSSLAPMLLSQAKAATKTKEEIENLTEARKELAKTEDDQRIEKLIKANEKLLEVYDKQLKSIESQYRTLQDMADVADIRAQAESDLKIAELELKIKQAEAGGGTDEQKRKQISDLQRQIRDEKTAQKIRESRSKASSAALAAEAAGGISATAAGRAGEATKTRQAIESRYNFVKSQVELAAKIPALIKENREVSRQIGKTSDPAARAKLIERSSQIDRQLSAARKAEIGITPEVVQSLASGELKQRLDAAKKAEESAKKEADDAAAAKRESDAKARLEEEKANIQTDVIRRRAAIEERNAGIVPMARPTPKNDVSSQLSSAGESVFGALSGIDMPSAGKSALTTAAEELTRNPSDKAASVMESTLEKLIDYMKRTNQASDAQYARILKLEREIETLRQRGKQNTLAK